MHAAKLVVVLTVVASIATAALALTFKGTEQAIAAQGELKAINKLDGIFFKGLDKPRTLKASTEIPLPASAKGKARTVKLFRVFLENDGEVPSYYAIRGAGFGYNKSVPITLLVGFNNAAKDGVALMDGTPIPAGRTVCVGWQVIKSEETPGLGEKIRDQKPEYTLTEKLTGATPPPSPDHRTPFQRQFAGKVPSEMVAKDTIDVITSATFTSIGVIEAIQDAEATLKAALAAADATPPAPPANPTETESTKPSTPTTEAPATP